MKTIKVRTDKKTGECYLKLSDFVDFVDTKKVKNYTLEAVHDGVNMSMVLRFFDKDGLVIDAKKIRS